MCDNLQTPMPKENFSDIDFNKEIENLKSELVSVKIDSNIPFILGKPSSALALRRKKSSKNKKYSLLFLEEKIAIFEASLIRKAKSF